MRTKKLYEVELIRDMGDLPSQFKYIWTYAYSQKQADLQAVKRNPGWYAVREE